jgi:hypothetical protein
MSLRPSQLVFWLVFASLAVGVLVACSSSSGGSGGDGGSSPTDGSEVAADSMTMT